MLKSLVQRRRLRRVLFLNLSVYDTLYLALAEEHGAVVFTADLGLQKIAAQLRLIKFWSFIPVFSYLNFTWKLIRS